ncbi:DUF2726 domain-containing protein [Streptomyces bacillaris]
MVARGGVRSITVNRYEAAADQMLQRTAAEHGDRLLLKVRLADAIDIDGMDNLSERAKSYALRAHLDFLMVDTTTGEGRFGVELDGRQHWSDPRTRERDQLKDDLCARAGLPLLRITSDFARRIGRWQVLSYLTEAFYRAEAFHDAQEQGDIPFDEPFGMGNFLTLDDNGQVSFDAADIRVRVALREHFQAGRVPAPMPDLFYTELPEERAVQVHIWMAVAHDRYLISRAVVRDFHFSGITPYELLEQLAWAELGELLDQWIGGEAAAQNGRDLDKAVAEVQSAIDATGTTLRVVYGPALWAGGTEVVLRFPAGDLRLPHRGGTVGTGTYGEH